MAYDDDDLREFVDQEFDGRSVVEGLVKCAGWSPLAPMPTPQSMRADELFARRHFDQRALAAKQEQERRPDVPARNKAWRKAHRDQYNASQRVYNKARRALKRALRATPVRLVLKLEERRQRVKNQKLAWYHRHKVLKPKAPRELESEEARKAKRRASAKASRERIKQGIRLRDRAHEDPEVRKAKNRASAKASRERAKRGIYLAPRAREAPEVRKAKQRAAALASYQKRAA